MPTRAAACAGCLTGHATGAYIQEVSCAGNWIEHPEEVGDCTRPNSRGMNSLAQHFPTLHVNDISAFQLSDANAMLVQQLTAISNKCNAGAIAAARRAAALKKYNTLFPCTKTAAVNSTTLLGLDTCQTGALPAEANSCSVE